MCPASLYSYFDAQQLADFIMNSQLTAYDGTGTATAAVGTNDSGNGQALAIGGAFANVPEDYEGYDNARARKRRLTVSGERRTDDISFSDANCHGILSMLDQQSQQQQQHSYDSSIGSSTAHGDLGSLLPGSALSSLPIPPGSEGSSTFNTALAGGMTFGGMNIQHSTCLTNVNSASISDSDTNFVSPHNPLSPPATGRASARKHQSLSIAIGRDGHNEYSNGSQEPVTPGMFSPSFMDAMEGAAAAAAAVAGMSSPPMFYNVTSPYTPGHSSHHHSFSLPGAVAQGPQTDIFSPGSLANTFGGEGLDHGTSNPATSLAYTGASTQQHGRVSMEDFSAGLNISMNAAAAAAMAAAMGSTYDGSDGRATSTASAFSRVPQGNSDMSHLLYSSAGGGTGSGLGLDISTTLGPFGNIPGLEQFSGPGALSLQGSFDQGRFTSVAGPPGLAISSPVVTASDAAAAAPATRIVKSPLAAGGRKSRKRAATVANIRTDSNQTGSGHEQRPPSSTALMPGNLETSSSSAMSSGIDESTGPAFNSQAVVRGSGSKVVMVLTSKVAQKSYGTEKRFLCPPPTVLLFGDSWGLPTNDGDVNSDAASGMPRISVAVPTNDGDAQGDAGDVRTAQLEWLAQPEAGATLKPHVPHTTAPARAPREGETVTGRFVAKQLFINDVDEKRKKVAVKVGLHDPTGRVQLGEFESRPIKVISKPSKKRQSVKNVDLCIHHGTTISLFNRLRSQTVSTKYLGATRSMSVGGPRPAWFPAGSDADTGSSTTTFVARNAVWDPFIIWIVNTHLTQQDVDAFNARVAKNRTPVPGYPTPPTFALHPQCPPDLDGDDGQTTHAPIPILYNQPVILQCVSTGMCSPVLTLRKVEKGSIAVGAFYGRDPSRDVLGDPVSQLHKVAFEVRVQSRDELPAVAVTPAGLNTRVGSYLTCMGDVVGLNATCDGRQLQADSAGSPRKKDAASAGTTSWAEDVGDNAVWTMVGTDCAIYRFDYPPAADIAMRARQAAQPALALPPTPTSPRSGQDCLAQQQQQQQYSFDMLFGSGSGSCETSGMDATLTAAVCSMNLPGLADGLAPHLLAPASLSAATSVTVAEPMSTHADERAVPVVFKSQAQHPPTVSPRALDGRHAGASAERACVTLHGINFTPDMVVQFGSQRSAYCEVRSDTCIVCLGPLPAEVAHSAREQPRAIPTSPSSSDLSNADDTRSFAPQDSPLRTHRASSAESTASSATATHSLPAAASAKNDFVKIPIYLSCNGGTGPTYKTGQFYSMHL
ncbi:hypothetical protein IWW36_000014 [Coemansia brasiliensis]|uniref:LAG1-DNAbind-domain-containing protein n=1 Tax=Coemansia brasiliensis TaxID=2650707 RepID=A0A9W8M239_9FUNG|nr:hypothetical protein IWW36_000014 [Coemansia brasiliensis]